MKKMISAAVICLSMLTTVKAESYIDYVSVGLALQTLQNVNNENIDNSLLNDDNGIAVVLTAGKYLYEDLALELEGSVSIDKAEWSLNDGRGEVDFWALGLYGSYIWRINNLSIKPRIGLVYENIKSTLGPISLIDKADMGLSGGIGLTYQFGQNYAIYSNFTKFEDDINHLTFGAEYKF